MTATNLQVIGVAVVAFVSTSFDNLALLVAQFASREARARHVAAGYLGVAWTVAALAWAGSKLVELVPLADLGLLGVIPIALGVQRLWQLRRPPAAGAALAPAVRAPAARGTAVAAALTLAQSVDSAVVSLSLFADSANALDPLLFVTLAGSALVWCAFALWLARYSPIAASLRRTMRLVAPWLLIAVGVYILSDTVTDMFER